MKAILSFLFLISIFLINQIFSKFLEDSKEKEDKRYKWNQDHADEITSGRVAFSYNEEQGTFCETKQSLFAKEFVFKVPKNYIICGCKY